MFGLLVILFLVVPIVELFVIVKVAGSIGVLETIGALVVVSIIGAWLVRRQGVAIWQRAQREMASGQMPDKSLLDGVLVLMGGALLLTPGFVTDGVGLLAVFPPTRAVIRAGLRRRFARRITVVGSEGAGFGTGPIRRSRPGFIDVDEVDLRRDDNSPADRSVGLPGDDHS
jgi:UPF0716 protein FxsA